MVRAFFRAVTFAVVCAGCSKSAEAELESARDANSEASALERVWRECRPISLSAEDGAGNPLPVSSPDFAAEVHRIHIGGRCKIDRTLIEPSNVRFLLRE
jgi:hypothetical protein